MWIKDPTTNKRSVSLTMLVISCLFILVMGSLQVFEKVKTTGPFMELMYSCMALYFGRRFSVNGKTFSANSSTRDDLKKVEE